MFNYFIIFTSVFLFFIIQNDLNNFNAELNEKWIKIEEMDKEYFKLVTYERNFGEQKMRPLVLNYQKLASSKK